MRANSVYVLGLTGGIGCGKSAAAACLKTLGAAHIDADAISRALTAPGGRALPGIRETFGEGVFASDGTLDRQALAQKVFTSQTERARLEAITHPMVLAEMLACTASAGEAGFPVAVWDVPLLFETGMDCHCESVWVLTAPEDVQIRRVCERGLTEGEARMRVRAQMSTAEKMRRATRVINTDREINETQAVIRRLYRELLQRL